MLSNTPKTPDRCWEVMRQIGNALAAGETTLAAAAAEVSRHFEVPRTPEQESALCFLDGVQIAAAEELADVGDEL